MTKRRNGRKAKVASSWDRRLRAVRTERAAEQAERGDWSKTAPRSRAHGVRSADPGSQRGWVADAGEAPDASD